MSDLTIMKLSHYSAPVTGGTEVILLCDRVAKGRYICDLKLLISYLCSYMFTTVVCFFI